MNTKMIDLVLKAIVMYDHDSFQELSDYLEDNDDHDCTWNGEYWKLSHCLRFVYEYEGDDDPERDPEDVSFDVIGHHLDGDEALFAFEIAEEMVEMEIGEIDKRNNEEIFCDFRKLIVDAQIADTRLDSEDLKSFYKSRLEFYSSKEVR